MDEMFDCWTVAKNPYDYHLYFREWSHIDTRDTVRRDRNHPSIILYSAGNEIRDTPQPELAREILKGLVEVFHANDSTRPVTQALFRPNVSHDYDNGLADLLDVVGQNYRENEILAAHQQKPTRKILGTENTHVRSAWLALRDNAAYAGQFLWAGIDYLGESRAWPAISGFFGLLDRTGEIKPMGYERQSWWSSTPMVHVTRRVSAREVPPTDPGYETYRRTVQTLFDDWTPPNSAAHDENVEVYSNCAGVELLLNGKSLGSKPLAADAFAGYVKSFK
jgi:beta-galactosidase